MKQFLLTIFGATCFSLLVTCCGGMKKKQGPANQILPNYLVLDSLVCIDLSENLKGLSSGDDEILLMTRVRNRYNSISGSDHGFTIFSKKHMVEKMNQRIPIQEIKPKPQFVIILLEQDTKRKYHELGNIVDTSNAFIDYPKVNKALLRKELGDDDLLGVKIIPLDGIENNKSQKTKLHGIHLFDEYEYWLYWHLEYDDSLISKQKKRYKN